MTAPLDEVLCCFLSTAATAIGAAGLDVPEFQYPSPTGNPPPNLEVEYLTSWAQGGIRSDPEAETSRRVATIRVGVGLIQQVKWTADNCRSVLGDCDDPQPGTYAFETIRQMQYQDVLTRLGRAVKVCICASTPDAWIPDPILAGSEIDDGHRPLVWAGYELRL